MRELIELFLREAPQAKIQIICKIALIPLVWRNLTANLRGTDLNEFNIRL